LIDARRRSALGVKYEAAEGRLTFGGEFVKCFFDENEARGLCRFCGRGVCKDHAEKRLPYIATVYVGANNTPKAVVVPDALWCGECKPEPQPVPMPEIY
jgi:hypothetical protein